MIYTVGDSFTAGAELDTKDGAWPYTLGRLFDQEIINDGKEGIGNEYIIRKTIQAVVEHKPDLVVVAWTSCARVEFADELGIYDIWPGCSSKKFQKNQYGYRQELIKYVTKHNNDEHEYRRWLRQVILLQNFLENNNQSYKFVSAFDNQIRNKKYKHSNKEYWDMINTEHFIGWPYEGLVEWAYGTPHGPGGHPLDEGHLKIGNKIAQHL